MLRRFARRHHPFLATLLILSLLGVPATLGCKLFSAESPPQAAPPPEATLPPGPGATSPAPAITAQPPTLQVEGPAYYVSPGGDDANPGSQEQPWRSLQKAADSAIPGDTVFLRAGTYREGLAPANSGSPQAWITFAAYPGEQAILDGEDLSMFGGWGGVIDLSERNCIRISGLHVLNSPGSGILVNSASHIVIEENYTYNTESSGIGVWNSQDVLVENNEVVLANNDGEQENITIAVTQDFVVRYNHVHDGGPGKRGGEGIDAKDGSSNGKVYGNHVHHVKRVGVYVDAWDKHTHDIDVFQNVVHDVEASGIVLASEEGGLLENVRVYNNLVYHNLYNGIEVATNGTARTQPVHKAQIVNNTVYGNGLQEWGGGILVDNKDAQAILIRNNIVGQNLSFQVAIERGDPAQVTSDHNLVDGFRDYEGELLGDQDLQGNPLFVNPENGDFHLQAGSPAIDSGSAEQAPPDDLEGKPRPQDGDGDGSAAWDIGAFEIAPPGL